MLPVYALFYFIYSACFVLAESAMQSQIPSETRATILSLSSLLYNLSGIAFTFIFAFAAQSFGLHAGFLFMAGYSVFMSLLFLSFKLFRNKRNV